MCNSSYGVYSTWLDSYDVVSWSPGCLRDDRPWRPQQKFGCNAVSSASHFPKISKLQHVSEQPLRVCTMSLEDQDVEILIDSGSDATVIPMEFAGCGRSLNGSSKLVDCQGNHLLTFELREFAFVLHTTCGKTVRFREVGHVSSSVSCPIISYGKLFKRGWRIGGNNDSPTLEHSASKVSIDMAFKNESFVLQGCIRRLQQVSAIRVELPQRWQQLSLGWYFTLNDLPMCRSNGDCFIDPTDQFSIVEYPFRTTIALKPDGWEVIENCKRLVHVVDKRARLGAQGAFTILSKGWFDMEECGIHRVVPQSAQPSDVSGGRQQSVPSSSFEPREPRALDLLSHSQPGVDSAPVVPEVDMQAGNDFPHDDSQPQPVVPDAQIQEDVGNVAGGVALPPAGGQEVSLVPDRSGVTVNEVHLTPNSPIRTLRAACSYLGISTSGGKAKLFG